MKRIIALILIFILFHCGKTEDKAVHSSKSMMEFEDIEPGKQCPEGGKKLNVGLDKNANNKLDKDEILSFENLCHGTKGKDGEKGINGGSCQIESTKKDKEKNTEIHFKCGDKSHKVTVSKGAKGDRGESGKAGKRVIPA